MKILHLLHHHQHILLILVNFRSIFFKYSFGKISDSPQWTNQQILPSWCTINYYEYSNKVGEQFRASSSQIFVDGYTSPYRNFNNRFSLGLLENVKRQKGVEYVRAGIGRGKRERDFIFK